MSRYRDTWLRIRARASGEKTPAEPPKLRIPFTKVTVKETAEYELSEELCANLRFTEGVIIDQLVERLKGLNADEDHNLLAVQCVLEAIYVRGFIDGIRHQAGAKQ